MNPGRRALLGSSAWLAAGARALDQPRVPLLFGETSNRPHWLAVFSLLAAETGAQWALRPLPWVRAQQEALAGEGLLFGIGRSRERERLFRFSRSVADTHVWVMAREGARALVHAPADLLDRPLCVARGAHYGDAFEALRPRLHGLMESDGRREGLVRMLRAGRCELALITARGADARAAATTLRASGLDLQGVQLLPKPLHRNGAHFAATPTSPWAAWLPLLDAALVRRRADIDALLKT